MVKGHVKTPLFYMREYYMESLFMSDRRPVALRQTGTHLQVHGAER
jgi:hypothetical protein